MGLYDINYFTSAMLHDQLPLFSNYKCSPVSCINTLEATQSPIGGSFQSLQPITEGHCCQAGENGNKRWLATCWEAMWYVDDIRALCVRAKTCPSPPQTTLETDGTVCPSTPLPVSLLAYYYEVVFNDIQIHTYINIIIPLLELHLRRMMPSAIVFVCALVCLYVCVFLSCWWICMIIRRVALWQCLHEDW